MRPSSGSLWTTAKLHDEHTILRWPFGTHGPHAAPELIAAPHEEHFIINRRPGYGRQRCMQLIVESCAGTPSTESICTITFAAIGYIGWKLALTTVRGTWSS